MVLCMITEFILDVLQSIKLILLPADNVITGEIGELNQIFLVLPNNPYSV